ncbi:MAG: ABC transporter transmembrane domain-containing protein, partial [Solirubrobacteraceae bacterium]
MRTDCDPAPIPWGRAFALLRPLRGGVLAMGGLTVSGVLIGLVPPVVLGALINALVARNATAHAALLAGLVALAMLLEAGAYVASDGMYARNASRLYRNLRLQMFRGALRRRMVASAEQTAGLPSRFISDAETLERMTLALLDRGLMQIVEFVGALTALAVLEPWTIAVVVPSLAATWLVARRVQEPTAVAGQQRQEQLEVMTSTLTQLLGRRVSGAGRGDQPVPGCGGTGDGSRGPPGLAACTEPSGLGRSGEARISLAGPSRRLRGPSSDGHA